MYLCMYNCTISSCWCVLKTAWHVFYNRTYLMLDNRSAISHALPQVSAKRAVDREDNVFRRRSKKTSKLRVTGLCAGNSPGTGEFSAQMASNAENVPIWWRHHVRCGFSSYCALPLGAYGARRLVAIAMAALLIIVSIYRQSFRA